MNYYPQSHAEYTLDQRKQFTNWLISRFDDIKSWNVVLNFKSTMARSKQLDAVDTSYQWRSSSISPVDEINDDEVKRIARLFENKINQAFYGSFYRRGKKKLTMTISHERDPHHHLHIQIEQPAHISTNKFIHEINKFALLTKWLNPLPYIKEPKSTHQTQIYNTKRGVESVIIF
jgi:hypothetical protein